MYSRYDISREKKLRLPENYGGCAFSERHTRSEPQRQLDIATPSREPHDESRKQAPVAAPSEKPQQTLPVLSERLGERCENEACAKTSRLSDTDHKALAKKNFPFGHGIGFEEMLLIGVIALLSESENGNDLLLWLMLLLVLS